MTSLYDHTPRYSVDDVRRAVNALCECGGAKPGEGCAACNVWHALFREAADDEWLDKVGRESPEGIPNRMGGEGGDVSSTDPGSPWDRHGAVRAEPVPPRNPRRTP